MSLKTGKTRQLFISNNYDECFIEPLSKYITCNKDSITFKEAMIYFEENVIISLLLKRITSSSTLELKYRLDNLKRKISNIKYSKDSYIKNKEKIEYCACCKLIEISKDILFYYNEVAILDHSYYPLENCIQCIKAAINNFETLKAYC